MNRGNSSIAQRRASRRRAQGKSTGEFDFGFPTNVQSLDDYYNNSITQEEIESLTSQYLELNDQVYCEFLQKTALDKKDLSFLLFATGLQCARQYLLTAFKERIGHEHTKKADEIKEEGLYEKAKGGENNTNKQGGYYYRTLNKILLEGVPYDTIVGSKGMGLGLSGPNHRYKTIGHDPVLGWVFGPMNIMTNTLTTHSVQSFHIRSTQVGGATGPSIYSRAQNAKILEASVNRLRAEPVACAAAVAKQAIHYNSDVYTKKSLPVPIIQTVSPELAKTLADYGLDMANIATIGKQATYAVMINMIIAMIHRMFYNPEKDCNEKLYEVRTRKIILYSNLIATCSNVLVVALTEDLKKLDIGGMIVTIYRVITDESFIRKVMYEFIDSEVTKVYDRELVEANEEFDRTLKDLHFAV